MAKRPFSYLQTAVGDLEAQITDILAQFEQEWGVSIFKVDLSDHKGELSARICLLVKRDKNEPDRWTF